MIKLYDLMKIRLSFYIGAMFYGYDFYGYYRKLTDLSAAATGLSCSLLLPVLLKTPRIVE